MSTKRKPNQNKSKSGKKLKESLLVDCANNNFQETDETPKLTEPYGNDSANKLPEEILQRYENKPGKLLIAGNVAWQNTSREELFVFNRFTDGKYRGVFSGPVALHSILINEDYKALSFGLNKFGQCGRPNPNITIRNKPELIKGLKHVNVIAAACGRGHSLFLTDTGAVYACGDNKNGQLGIGKKANPIVTEPTRIKYTGPPICKIGCGAEFSVILDVEGNLYTFGLPEFGQLGHNTDGKFFITSNKLAFDIVYSPKQVTSYVEKTKEGRSSPVLNVKIVDFSCGKNHTVAIDSEKRAFSFGFGGFGRLGHSIQEDEWMPRLIKYLNMRVTGGASRVFCGSTFSLVISGHNNPYLFGKNSARDALMYPKAVDPLCGFEFKSIGCSFTSIVLASKQNKLIAWGASPTYGELGIGKDPKSSSQPTFVETMNDVNILQVAMGQEHSLLLVNVDETQSNEKYSAQPKNTFHKTKKLLLEFI